MANHTIIETKKEAPMKVISDAEISAVDGAGIWKSIMDFFSSKEVITTRGSNPFNSPCNAEDGCTIPYVTYEEY